MLPVICWFPGALIHLYGTIVCPNDIVPTSLIMSLIMTILVFIPARAGINQAVQLKSGGGFEFLIFRRRWIVDYVKQKQIPDQLSW